MKKLCGVISTLGFLLIFGSVGAVELGNIGLLQGTLQATLGLIMFGGGAFLSGTMK
jgi:hypothetical protein